MDACTKASVKIFTDFLYVITYNYILSSLIFNPQIYLIYYSWISNNKISPQYIDYFEPS